MNIFFKKKCKKDVKLAPYTSFKIGGKADYFFVAKSRDDLIEAVKAAKKAKIGYYILSGGSNVLVADEGFRGLIIKVQSSRPLCFAERNGRAKLKVKSCCSKLKVKSEVKSFSIEADAGVSLGKLVDFAMENALTGLEFLTGVPGTVGGAVYGNAGAYGKEIKDVVKKVVYYDVELNKVVEKEVEEVGFEYRSSEFKKSKGRKIILAVEFKLKIGDKEIIREEMKRIALARGKKIPLEPSAGSVFKNILIADYPQILGRLDADQTELERFEKTGKIPAGFLIEKCGLRGKMIGKARISEKHANFIVNVGGAKARDVVKLVKLVKQKVKEKFGVELELEIVLVR